MSEKLTFSHTFGITTIAGTSTHYLDSISGIGMQSRAPIYGLAYFGVSVMARSGTWGVRMMAKSPDGTLYPIAGSTALTTIQVALGFPAGNAGNSAFLGVPCPAAIEYCSTGGVSPSFSARTWGVLYNP